MSNFVILVWDLYEYKTIKKLGLSYFFFIKHKVQISAIECIAKQKNFAINKLVDEKILYHFSLLTKLMK